MSLPHGLLGLLNYGDLTGYELSKTFNESLSFFWSAQTSQIYRELNRMEKKGWLTSKMEFQTTKPNKRIYSITEEGKKELSSWIHSEMPSNFLPAKNDILLRIFFSAQRTKEDNISVLQEIIQNYKESLSQIESADENIENYSHLANSKMDTFYWQLTKDYGRMFNEMCIAWAENCIKKIKQQ